MIATLNSTKRCLKTIDTFRLRKRFWGRHVGARGYFCRSSGNVTDEVIKAYIESQSHASDEVFRLEGEESPPEEPPSA